jgi:UDP-2-acetamido-2-deoxy-ribo-hexuluronate aminotransferase
VADATAHLPVGDAAAKRVISLPMGPYISNQQNEKIVKEIFGK